MDLLPSRHFFKRVGERDCTGSDSGTRNDYRDHGPVNDVCQQGRGGSDCD